MAAGRSPQRALSATFVALFLHVAFFMSFYCGLRAVGGAGFDEEELPEALVAHADGCRRRRGGVQVSV